jgi:hypothetical protein
VFARKSFCGLGIMIYLYNIFINVSGKHINNGNNHLIINA